MLLICGVKCVSVTTKLYLIVISMEENGIGVVSLRHRIRCGWHLMQIIWRVIISVRRYYMINVRCS